MKRRPLRLGKKTLDARALMYACLFSRYKYVINIVQKYQIIHYQANRFFFDGKNTILRLYKMSEPHLRNSKDNFVNVVQNQTSASSISCLIR